MIIDFKFKDFEPISEIIDGSIVKCKGIETTNSYGDKIVKYVRCEPDEHGDTTLHDCQILVVTSDGTAIKTVDIDSDSDLCVFRYDNMASECEQNIRQLISEFNILKSFHRLNFYFGFFGMGNEVPSAFGGTMCADGENIYINPIYCDTLLGLGEDAGGSRNDSKYFKFVIFHEMMHNFFNHCGQHMMEFRQFPDPLRANIAMDHQINIMLETVYGFAGIPDELHLIIDKKLNSAGQYRYLEKRWEAIYQNLNDQQNKQPQKKQKGPQPPQPPQPSSPMSEDMKRGVNDINSVFRDLCNKMHINKNTSTPADYQRLKDEFTKILSMPPFKLDMSKMAIVTESVDFYKISQNMSSSNDYNDGVIAGIEEIYDKLEDAIAGNTPTSQSGNGGGGFSPDDNFSDIFKSPQSQNQQNQQNQDKQDNQDNQNNQGGGQSTGNDSSNTNNVNFDTDLKDFLDSYQHGQLGNIGRDVFSPNEAPNAPEKIKPKNNPTDIEGLRNVAKDVTDYQLGKDCDKNSKEYIDRFNKNLCNFIPEEQLNPYINWVSILKNKMKPVKKVVRQTNPTFRYRDNVDSRLSGYETSREKVTVYSMKHISFVIDRSGSIYGNPDFPAYFLGELTDIVKMLLKNTKKLTIDFSFFDDKIDLRHTFTIASVGEMAVIQEAMKHTDAGGGTSYTAAYEEAYKYLHDKQTDFCIIVTDDDFGSHRSSYNKFRSPGAISGKDFSMQECNRLMMLQYSNNHAYDYETGENGMINIPIAQLDKALAEIRKNKKSDD